MLDSHKKRIFSFITVFSILFLVPVLFSACSLDLLIDQDAVTVPGDNTETRFAWLAENAKSYGKYIVEIDGKYTFNLPSQIFDNLTHTTIHIKGTVPIAEIELYTGSAPQLFDDACKGPMFWVRKNTTLIIENVILHGHEKSDNSLIRVDTGGVLIMNTGAAIIGNNTALTSAGGGVFVNGGTFIMNDGEIRGCGGAFGAGVYVGNGGSFTMKGGTIKTNNAKPSAGIENSGGGVYVANSIFTMDGGTIEDNWAQYGGGVMVTNSSVFTMNNGVIKNNANPNSDAGGGGVMVKNSAVFTMNNGEISYNESPLIGFSGTGYGGGVNVESAVFNMNGGTIKANEAYMGGGVYINENGTMKKTGGLITGAEKNIVSGEVSYFLIPDSNTAKEGEISGSPGEYFPFMGGHALYCYYHTNGVSATIYRNSGINSNTSFLLNPQTVLNGDFNNEDDGWEVFATID